jgi:hypothetical protein
MHPPSVAGNLPYRARENSQRMMPITRRFGCCLDDVRGLTCWLGIGSLKALGRVRSLSWLANEWKGD